MGTSKHYRTASQISDYLNGQISGDPDLQINGLSAIESDIANTITFYGHPKYEKRIYGQQSRAVIVPLDFQPRDTHHLAFIKVRNVYEALSSVSDLFAEKDVSGIAVISHNCMIHPNAKLGNKVSIGHYAIIEEGAIIGEGTIIHAHVFIGREVVIGNDSIIHQGVKILDKVQIGDRCVIYPNAVIGSEGFGHALSNKGYKKIIHQGTVYIEDDVEIGSSTCIDRGAMKDTIIRRGAKLDNLIQIAHGVEIGENVAIAAQTGISGSTTIGKESLIGGQVGIAGHVHIAAHSKIQAKSGIASNIVEPNKKWYGYPSLSYLNYLRSYAIFKDLPNLLKRLRNLEKKWEDKR